MADRPGDDPGKDPAYDWLYRLRADSGPADPGPANRAPGAMRPPQDDETRPIRRSAPEEAEATRVLPTSPPPRAAAGSERSGRSTPIRPAPAPTPAPPAQRRPRRRRLSLGRVLVTLLLLWLLFLVAVPIWAWTRIDRVAAEPRDQRPAEQPGTTYLLVGSDSRGDLSEEERERLGTGNAGGQRTDTIMLLQIGSGPNLLMSIPRDSRVAIPGYGEAERINAAYAYGGPRLLVRTVEDATGIRVDNYVEIGFGGFVGVVDALGGIEICPTEAMQDPEANLDIAEGCQQADGVTALGYARSRKTSELGDIDRARHQREVVSAIGAEAVSPRSVLDPVRYLRLNLAGSESVAVGEQTGPIDLARFAWAMTRVDGEKGLTCGVPIADLTVTWDAERSAEMFQHVIEDDVEGIPRSLCTPSGLPR